MCSADAKAPRLCRYMSRLIEKLHLDRFVNANLILALDVLASLGASVVSLFFANSFIRAISERDTIVWWLVGSVVISLFFFRLLDIHRAIIRHSTVKEIWKVAVATLGKGAVLGLFLWLIPRVPFNERFYVGALLLDLMLTFVVLVVMRVGMIVVYDAIRNHTKKRGTTIMIYGTGDKAVSLVTRLQNSPHYHVAAFIVYGREWRHHSIANHPVCYFESQEDVAYLQKRYGLEAVLFASETDARDEQERLLRHTEELGIKVLIAPPIDEVIDGCVMKQNVREIKIEDLLGRPEIEISMADIEAEFRGKTMLVTGAAGSIGSELCRQLSQFGIRHLVLFDNAETPVHNLRLELEERFPNLQFTPIIGDVRMEQRLDFAFRTYRPQIVFHAAAYKHVPLMEENPCEAMMVNVAGSRNVADKCIAYEVEKMVMISTDKAVNPTNIMGCTKRLAEIYVQSLGLAVEQGTKIGKTRFVTTRFGNVLGSNGSVIPRFREQIAKGGPVTVTHPEITRFFMTIPEACRLVMEAATMATGTQIFVFDMGESVKIDHLARRMIKLAGLEPERDIEIAYTGLRPGEKLYEEVLSNTENTLPTSHDRIRIAKVRNYDHKEAVSSMEQLVQLAQEVDIPQMVRLMKRVVPEYKSQNSDFEMYDIEQDCSQVS